MGRNAQQRVVAYVAALATVLVGVMALAGASTSTGPDLVVLSLAALALGCAIRLAGNSVALVPSRAALAPRRGADDVPVLTDRVTDPAQHPLAPRAPGLF